MNRRAFLRTAAGLLVAAPAIVRAESLMPVRAVLRPGMTLTELSRLLNPGPSIAEAWVRDGRPHDDLVDAMRHLPRPMGVDLAGGLSFSRVLIADGATGRHIAWFDLEQPPGPGDTVTVEFPADGRLFVHSPA